MERNAKIGIAGVVLVGLGVGVYFQHKKDDALGTAVSKADLPELKLSDDLDKLDIVNGSKGEVVLEKHGDKWELTKPVSAPANQTNVKSLLDNVKELSLADRAMANADDEAKKTYELTPDKAVHVVAFKGADKKLDATFGKSGGLGDAMMLSGKPDIYLVKGYSSWMYGREPKDWRDREIFKFEDADVVSLALDGKNGHFVFTKGDAKDGGSAEWTGTSDKKPIPHFDPEKAKSAIGAFKNLSADDFGDGKPPSETGLDSPEETVTVKMKDGAMHVLKIGKTADKSHYAQKDGDATIFTIGAYPYEWASGELSKFQQASDAGAPDSGAHAKAATASGKGDAGKK